ncbi:MAG: gas vesicle protein [Gemmatimonadaceae bacterium]
MSDDPESLPELYEPEQLVLSDLINRVLDKGVVLSAEITISIADIDLVQLDLKLLVSSLASLSRRASDDKRNAGGVRGDRLLVRPRPRS